MNKCPKCREDVQERTFYHHSDLLLYFLLYSGIATGVVLAFQVRNIGWIIGSGVIIVALWCGLRVRGALVCRQCGYTVVFRHFGQE